MKDRLKRTIGNFAISAGKYAVGKSLVAGMFDPKIPDALKVDSRKKPKGYP